MDVFIEGVSYKLRAGSPMPIGSGRFVLQTFMAEESDIVNYLYTENLPRSSEFRGQGGNLVSAAYTRIMNVSGDAFTGKEISAPRIVSER